MESKKQTKGVKDGPQGKGVHALLSLTWRKDER